MGPSSQPSPPASLLRRLAAIAYDGLICSALVLGLVIAFTLLMGGATEELRGPGPAGRSFLQVALVAVLGGYFVGSWVYGGQTLGMRPWLIRVVTADGHPISVQQGVIRFAAALLSWAPAGLGFWWALLDPERRTWHDRLSETRIVRIPKPASALTE